MKGEEFKLRTFSLAKALTGANSPKDYHDMAAGIDRVDTYSGTHLPYHCGDRNLIAEYAKLVNTKGVTKNEYDHK